MSAYTLSLFEDAPQGGWSSPSTRRLTPRELLRQKVMENLGDDLPNSVQALYNSVGHAPAPGARDLDTELARVLSAFLRGEFMLLVDNQQIHDLQQEITLKEGAEIRFIPLIPLMIMEAV